ncbi:MAG: helix-turn-helix domain-containing protein [Candidatus Woesebacteria bacterium]|nr:helix-turn-helix domain-containing protein [Candidatus Woesebacteria bacterium]
MDKISVNVAFIPESPRTWPPLLNINQVSQILNLSKWTLRNWDKDQKLIPIRVGSRKDRRYKKEDVLKVLNEGLK